MSNLKNLPGPIPDLTLKEVRLRERSEIEGKETGMRSEFLSPTSSAKDMLLVVALQTCVSPCRLVHDMTTN